MMAGKDTLSELKAHVSDIMGISFYRSNFPRVIKLVPEIYPLYSLSKLLNVHIFQCTKRCKTESLPSESIKTNRFPRPKKIPNVSVPVKRVSAWPLPGAGAFRESQGSSRWRSKSEQTAAGLRAALCLHPHLSRGKRL